MCVCVCVCVSQKHTSPKFDLISVHGASAKGEVKVVLDLCQSWVQQKGASFPRRPSSTGRQVWFSPQWGHRFFPLGPDACQILPVPPCFLQSWGGLAFKFRVPSKSFSINYHWLHSKSIQHAYKVLTLSWTSLHSSHWIQNSNLSKRGGNLDNPGKDFCWNILVLVSASVEMFAGWCSSACSNSWFILPLKEEIHCQQRLIVLHGRY